MSQRDRRFRIAKPRRAVGIESLQHLHILDHRQYVAHRLLEADAALLDQLHGRGAGDGLGHRRDAEHRVERHRFGLVDRPSSERALIEDAAIVGGQRDDARNETRFDRLPEDFINDHCRLCWNLANCSIALCQLPRAKRNQHGASIRPPLSHEPTYAMQQTIQNLPATEKLVSVTFPVSMSCFNLCRFAVDR